MDKVWYNLVSVAPGVNMVCLFFIIVNKIFTVAWCKYNFFWKRLASFRFSIFKKFQVFFHGQLLLSFYMSDVKYNCCTARQMGEKLSDFSNVVIVKGLLIKWFDVNIIFSERN